MAEEKETKQEAKNEKPQDKQEATPKEEINLIVRIANVDLNGKISIIRALTKIKGVGLRTAKNVGHAFEKETKKSYTTILGKINDEETKKLEEIVLNQTQFGIPDWSLNRRRDYETGKNIHLVTSELDLSLRQDVQRLSEIKSYRGFRHNWGLPLRGQRTKSTHRGKGTVVGVTKKDIKIEKK